MISFRAIVQVSALPDGTGLTPQIAVPHGISNLGAVERLFGTFTNPSSGVSIPVPYPGDQQASPGVGAVALYLDGPNVVLTSVGVDASAYSGFVVIEYQPA